MYKVQQTSGSQWYIPSSKPFRIQCDKMSMNCSGGMPDVGLQLQLQLHSPINFETHLYFKRTG
jgi:hypothetical protein